jgi:hypothetical protein
MALLELGIIAASALSTLKVIKEKSKKRKRVLYSDDQVSTKIEAPVDVATPDCDTIGLQHSDHSISPTKAPKNPLALEFIRADYSAVYGLVYDLISMGLIVSPIEDVMKHFYFNSFDTGSSELKKSDKILWTEEKKLAGDRWRLISRFCDSGVFAKKISSNQFALHFTDKVVSSSITRAKNPKNGYADKRLEKLLDDFFQKCSVQ